jgi:hypothetical protein
MRCDTFKDDEFDMNFPGRMNQKVVSKTDPIFPDVCELIELDTDQVEYLIYEDFEEVDYSLYQDMDDIDTDTSWQPESRIIEVYYSDTTQEEIEIEIGSELDEALKRLLG